MNPIVKENKKKLRKAFNKLRTFGFVAKMNFSCCMSCAWSELDIQEDETNVVFFHRQDNERLNKTGVVDLAWSGDANTIVQTLNSFGLLTKWNGSEDMRIEVNLNV